MSDHGPSAWKIQQAMAIWHERQKMLLAEDGEVSDEAVRRAQQAQESGIEAMQVWIVRAIRSAEAMAAAVKQERQDLAVREKRFETRGESLRSSLAAILEISAEPDKDGKRKVVLPIATLTLAPGGQKLDIDDDTKIPDEYFVNIEHVKVRKGLNKDRLIEAISGETVDQQTGEVLPPVKIEGVRLTNGGPQLTIRGK